MRKRIRFKTVLVSFLLCFFVFFLIGCRNKEPKLQFGHYKSASGMEVYISEDTLKVINYDFSSEEKSRVEFEYSYQYTEYGLAEGEQERTLQEIDDATDMNDQFVGKNVSYSTQIEGENNDKIGIYCAINGLTTWFYLEYFPENNTIVFTPEKGDAIKLDYQGEVAR